jgi:hypothetical protein
VPYILSCNEPLGKACTRWCAQCEKCAFVYALLAACLEPPEVWAIFGDDLLQLDEPSARFEELIGCRGATRLPNGRQLPGKDALAALHAAGKGGAEARMLSYLKGHTLLKPLDCVGTKEEARMALLLAERRRDAWVCRQCSDARTESARGAGAGNTGASAPPRFFRGGVWQRARAEVLASLPTLAPLLDDFQTEHLLPPWLEPTLRKLHTQRAVTAEQLVSAAGEAPSSS